MANLRVILASVGIHERAGIFYVNPMAYTDMGLRIGVEPYEKILKQDLGKRCLEILENPLPEVPHPASWDSPSPLVKLAGVTSWSEFVRNCKYYSVELRCNTIVLSLWARDGAGFGPSDTEPLYLPIDSSACDIQIALESLIEEP